VSWAIEVSQESQELLDPLAFQEWQAPLVLADLMDLKEIKVKVDVKVRGE